MPLTPWVASSTLWGKRGLKPLGSCLPFSVSGQVGLVRAVLAIGLGALWGQVFCSILFWSAPGPGLILY